MKKLITYLIFLLCGIDLMYAEDYNIIQQFFYHDCTVLNRDFSVQQRIPSENGDPLGMYVLADIQGTKFIMATVGKDTEYEIQVVNIVTGDEENGSRIDMYQGGMHIEGQIIVINVFLEYNLNRNRSVPETITVDVNNSTNFIQFSGLLPIK